MDKYGNKIWNDTLAYFAEEYGRDSKQYKHMRRGAKRSLNQGAVVCPPLTEEARNCYDNDGDGWKEYGYFDGSGMTDDEVREYIDENIRVRPPYSPYDCTGRAFTWLVDWHRNPSGLISYINRMTLDL